MQSGRISKMMDFRRIKTFKGGFETIVSDENEIKRDFDGSHLSAEEKSSPIYYS